MIRLPYILVAMALVLLAGLVSVKHLEGRLGAPTVSGTILVEVPGIPADLLDELQDRWPGARLEWVPAGGQEAPFGPFEDFTIFSDEGVATVLLSSRHVDRQSAHDLGWLAVLDGFESEEGTPVAAVTQRAGSFLAEQTGSRPFVLGVDLGTEADLEQVTVALDLLTATAATLPSFRRTAVVALGARDEEAIAGQTGRRWCLRIPVGNWEHHAQAGLKDLLDPGP